MAKVVSHDSETPAVGQQVITACAFIHHNFNGITKVFMPKRAKTKKFMPDIYELPGGHIDFGEDIVLGLKREIKEEIDMDINVGDSFFTFTYDNNIKGSHSIEVIYFATFLNPLNEIKIQPEDHSGYEWFTESEILIKVVSKLKPENDGEIQGILKGFALLKGMKPDFGYNPCENAPTASNALNSIQLLLKKIQLEREFWLIRYGQLQRDQISVLLLLLKSH